MDQFKDVESLTKTFIDGLTGKIGCLENQTKKIQTYETQLLAKIEKLFDETTALMKQPQPVNGDKLSHRLTSPYKPITQVQDRVFPAPDALSYDN
jgi:hypothetical protein